MLAYWRPKAGKTGQSGAANHSERWARRFGMSAIAAVATALVVGACGGGGSSTATAASTTTTTLTRAARNQAYLQCLQSHGVNVTNLGGLRGGANASTTLPPGVTQQQLTAATQACQSLRPTGGGGANAQNNPAFAAYRNCINLQLQKAGATTLPPPGQGAGGGGLGNGRPPAPGETTTTNPVMQAARQACAALLPAGGFGGANGGGGADGSTTTPTT